MMNDGDAAIRMTDRDAALARLSAVKNGYIKNDPFIEEMVGRRGAAQEPGTRGPVINVGTYVRGAAVDRLVEGWLEMCAGTEGKKGQIVSLGAGSDTRFWRIATGKHKDVLAKYVEIDFGEVTSKKAMTIRKSNKLREVVGSDMHVEMGGMGLRGERYVLLAADLREDLEGTVGGRLREELSQSMPTLLLCECVLVYMSRTAGATVLEWFARYFAGVAAVGGIAYEMIGLEDGFGRVMVENLKTRGVVLPGLVESEGALGKRFLSAGFAEAGAKTLREVWRGLGAGRREELVGVEGLDELEELELVLGHYGIGWGWTVFGAWPTSQRED